MAPSSDTQPVKSCVPRDTVLGPLLFLLYINNIENNPHSTIYTFANESTIYNRKNRLDRRLTNPSTRSFKLQDWADKWYTNFLKSKNLWITKRTKNRVTYTYLMLMPTSPIPGAVVISQVFDIASQVIHVNLPNNNFSPLDEVPWN